MNSAKLQPEFILASKAQVEILKRNCRAALQTRYTSSIPPTNEFTPRTLEKIAVPQVA